MDDKPRTESAELFGEQFKAAMEQFGKAMSQAGRTLAAQGAMGWAYRGDVEQVRAAAKRMTPDQLTEVSTAAAMLASVCDEELQRRERA